MRVRGQEYSSSHDHASQSVYGIGREGPPMSFATEDGSFVSYAQALIYHGAVQFPTAEDAVAFAEVQGWTVMNKVNSSTIWNPPTISRGLENGARSRSHVAIFPFCRFDHDAAQGTRVPFNRQQGEVVRRCGGGKRPRRTEGEIPGSDYGE